MIRIKRSAVLTGKWRDIDNVFTYIPSGRASFVIDGKRYELKPGSAIIIPPYQTHLIVSHDNVPLVQYIFHFDFYERPERIHLESRDVLEQTGPAGIPEQENVLRNKVVVAEIPGNERNLLVSRFLDMYNEFEEHPHGYGLILKAGCMDILVRTLRATSLKPEKEKGTAGDTSGKSWIHIENAIDYIQKVGIHGDLDNTSIAKVVGVSANYLTKVFQDRLGMSLHRYIINYRLECAQRLLLTGKVNITEAAQETGFSSIHIFSKSFRETVGMTPSAFLDETVSREQLLVNIRDTISKDISAESGGDDILKKKKQTDEFMP